MSVKELLDLGARKAIVTGGSRGLGLQIAEALGEMGAELLVSARKPAELEQAVAHLRAKGIAAQALAVDLSQPQEVPAFADEALARLGHVDILVNNAGANWGAPAEDYPLDAWMRLMNLNLTAAFLLAQRIGKRSMIPRRYGRILNVASIAGLAGNPPDTVKTLAYNASKGGLVNFTRALAAEWGEHGITVNAIAPGFFASRMTRGVMEELGERLVRDVPLRRIGGDEDLKGAALLFCSDAGRHVTGQILAVDGGASAVI